MEIKGKKVFSAICASAFLFAYSTGEINFRNFSEINKLNAVSAEEEIDVEISDEPDNIDEEGAIEGYFVYRYSSENGKWVKIRDVSAETADAFEDGNLKYGTAYIYRIRPYQISSGKKVAFEDTKKDLPYRLRPANVSVKASVSGKNLTLKWSKTNCSQYRIYLYKNGKWVVYKNISKNKTSYTLSNVKSKSLSLKVIPVLKTSDGKIYKSADNALVKANMTTKKTVVSKASTKTEMPANKVKIDAENGTLTAVKSTSGISATCSKLASWKWSGKTNNYNTRDHKIDKITIHHQAEINKTLSQTAEILSSHQGSANYIIDSNGKIGVMIDEKYRAWTSSNRDNDMRAVTIEVANDDYANGKWHVSDKALASLINLCTDICKRNGISKLNFTGNAKGNLTMHKFFADTICPGPYLGGKFSYIATEVNKRLGK